MLSLCFSREDKLRSGYATNEPLFPRVFRFVRTYCFQPDDSPLVVLYYSAFTTLATVPTLLFSNLHMDAFLNVHGLSTGDVARVHVFYSVWNTLNDVFAGVFSDFIMAKFKLRRIAYLKLLSIVWVIASALPFLLVSDSGLATSVFGYFVAHDVVDVEVQEEGAILAKLVRGERAEYAPWRARHHGSSAGSTTEEATGSSGASSTGATSGTSPSTREGAPPARRLQEAAAPERISNEAATPATTAAATTAQPLPSLGSMAGGETMLATSSGAATETLWSAVLLYLVTLFIYDGCASFAIIARNIVSNEIAQSEPERLSLQRWNSIFGVTEFVFVSVGVLLYQHGNTTTSRASTTTTGATTSVPGTTSSSQTEHVISRISSSFQLYFIMLVGFCVWLTAFVANRLEQHARESRSQPGSPSRLHTKEVELPLRRASELVRTGELEDEQELETFLDPSPTTSNGRFSALRINTAVEKELGLEPEMVGRTQANNGRIIGNIASIDRASRASASAAEKNLHADEKYSTSTHDGVPVDVLEEQSLPLAALSQRGPPETTNAQENSANLPSAGEFVQSLSLNFWLFVAVYALVEMQSVFSSQFLLMGLHRLYPHSKVQILAAYGLIGGAAGGLRFVFTWVAAKVGVYRIVLQTFYLKLGVFLLFRFALWEEGSSLLAFDGAIISPPGGAGTSTTTKPVYHLWTILVLIVVHEACVLLQLGYSNILLNNLIDEYAVDKHTQLPPAGYFFSALAACVKPLNSVGPILGAYWMESLNHPKSSTSSSPDTGRTSGERQEDAATQNILYIQLAIAVVQTVLWSRFTLHGSKLRMVQEHVKWGLTTMV
ncbi:unnamed protein product [Amoebophrya sp. A120]|nr:unnamed protein product [Amoebophrya sp. A120]|eukprot:GSA120T00003448001.1